MSDAYQQQIAIAEIIHIANAKFNPIDRRLVIDEIVESKNAL